MLLIYYKKYNNNFIINKCTKYTLIVIKHFRLKKLDINFNL